MAYINEEKKEVNGLTTHIIQTEKFKTTTLVLKMLAPLKKEDVTNRALLPYVLQRGTKSFSSTTELRKHLDELYGATLQVDLTKKGENHVISFRMEVPNEKFLSDQTPLLEHALKLLSEIVLSPVEENGSFKKEFVEQEKRSLKQRIQAVYDDKMRYSNLRLVQEMCEGEAYALHVNGEKDEAEKITPESLYKYYERCKTEDKMDLYLVGDLAESDVKNLVMKYFTFKGNSHNRAAETKTSKKIDKVKEKIEEQDVKQGKLNIGYRTNCTYQDEDYHALQVFNGIYGGFSHSKLFINVRERASLAYYAASRVESHKGLLMVMSGIEFANYDQAVTIIKEQMTAMKNGEFTEKEIEQTKAVIRNQLLETIDTSYGMVEVLYHNVIAKVDRTFDEWIEKINDVKKEDIIKAADKIELDTIYFLKGMGGNQ